MIQKDSRTVRLQVRITLAVVLLLLVAFMASCRPLGQSTNGARETVLARVVKARAIRCSYLVYSPYFRKDPNTGALSGIFHDVMEEVGRNAHLKVDWVEEVGYDNIFPGLESGRHDVFAGGLWPNATRAQAGFFSIPIFFSGIKAWGRPDDLRFVNNLEAIDSPNVRIAAIDGAMEDLIAKTDFPKAHEVALPELSPFTQNLLNVTSRKADVTFAEPGIVKEFLATNPGALRELAPDKPLRVFGNSLVVKLGEVELRDFLDVALRELLYSGRVERILKQYEPGPGVFYRTALPYQPSQPGGSTEPHP